MTTPVLPLKARLARIAPFFRASRRGLVLAFIGSVIAAATEPAIPALLGLLLDKGFKNHSLPLWQVPGAIIAILPLRGITGVLTSPGPSEVHNATNAGLREGRVR